jgi:hypothetical protein
VCGKVFEPCIAGKDWNHSTISRCILVKDLLVEHIIEIHSFWMRIPLQYHVAEVFVVEPHHGVYHGDDTWT